MKKNTFLVHLDTLKPAEVKKFGAYLKLKYSNSERLLKAYRYYVKFHKKTKPPPELEVVFQKINLRKHKSDSELKYLSTDVSDLFQRLKEFLIQEKILTTKFEKEFLWLQILDEKDLSHQRKLQFEKIKKEQSKAKYIWKGLNELRLYNQAYFRNNFEKENAKISLIEDGIQSLNDFYISFHLKYASELLNRKNVLTTKAHLSPLLNDIVVLIQKKQVDTSLTSELYFEL